MNTTSKDREVQTFSDGSNPEISVIMPMFNARPFLEKSIGSILSQSFPHFELIIVDNGSTDGSKQYAESLPDPRIRVISEPVQGTSHAVNAGMAASRADILAFMDADDVSSPDRFSIQFAYLRDHPETVLLGTRFTFLLGEQLVPVPPQLMHHRQIRSALLQGIPVVATGSCMLRASAARRVGGQRLSGPAHDLDFFLRMSEVGTVHNLPDALYHYRLHDSSSTTLSTAIITEHKMFAAACAMARDAGIPEPAFSDFHRAWCSRPPLRKLGDRARELSARIYRKAIIQRGNGKLVSPALGVVCSALLNPRVAIVRIRRQLSSLNIRTYPDYSVD